LPRWSGRWNALRCWAHWGRWWYARWERDFYRLFACRTVNQLAGHLRRSFQRLVAGRAIELDVTHDSLRSHRAVERPASWWRACEPTMHAVVGLLFHRIHHGGTETRSRKATETRECRQVGAACRHSLAGLIGGGRGVGIRSPPPPIADARERRTGRSRRTGCRCRASVRFFSEPPCLRGSIPVCPSPRPTPILWVSSGARIPTRIWLAVLCPFTLILRE
jgi:hypothetical protein